MSKMASDRSYILFSYGWRREERSYINQTKIFSADWESFLELFGFTLVFVCFLLSKCLFFTWNTSFTFGKDGLLRRSVILQSFPETENDKMEQAVTQSFS